MSLEDLMKIKREIENSDAMQRCREIDNLIKSVYEQTISCDIRAVKRQTEELYSSLRANTYSVDVNRSISPTLELAAASIRRWNEMLEITGLKALVEDLKAAATLANTVNKLEPTDEPDVEYIESEEAIQAFSGAVEVALPYIPEEAQTAYTEKVNEAKAHRRLSFSDIISLLGILWAIVSTIIAGLPDEQLDRIITQQEAIIDQQAELIELEREDAELVEKLASLSDAIYALSDEVEALREQQEDADDASNEGGDEANGGNRPELTCVE